MASRASETIKRSGSSLGGAVLGKSAATGRYVFLPATSKGATISMRKASSAVQSISEKKK